MDSYTYWYIFVCSACIINNTHDISFTHSLFSRVGSLLPVTCHMTFSVGRTSTAAGQWTQHTSRALMRSVCWDENGLEHVALWLHCHVKTRVHSGKAVFKWCWADVSAQSHADLDGLPHKCWRKCFCTLNAVFLTSMFGLDLCQLLYQQYNNNNIFTLKQQNTGGRGAHLK